MCPDMTITQPALGNLRPLISRVATSSAAASRGKQLVAWVSAPNLSVLGRIVSAVQTDAGGV